MENIRQIIAANAGWFVILGNELEEIACWGLLEDGQTVPLIGGRHDHLWRPEGGKVVGPADIRKARLASARVDSDDYQDALARFAAYGADIHPLDFIRQHRLETA